MSRFRLPDTIARELARIKADRWRLVIGGNTHAKLLIDGFCVGVMSDSSRCGDRRATLNLRAQIRRHLAGQAIMGSK